MEKTPTEKLLEMRSRIEEMKRMKAEAEGAKSQILAQIKKDFGVSDLISAEKKIKQMEQELRKLAEDVQTGLKKLEAEYEW